MPTVVLIFDKGDSTESAALKLHPNACCDINLTANDSSGRTANYFIFYLFVLLH